MNTSSAEMDGRAPVAAWCDDVNLHVKLTDGRRIVTPLWWYPALLHASHIQRNTLELMYTGIHWPDLDEDLSIEGMALGLNGKEVDVGQAWLKKSWQLPANTALKTPTTLSNLGTIIASEGGAGSDEFFLSFAKLGNKSHVRVSPSYNEQGFDIQASQSASQGLRTFAKIHASMSELTGVAMSQSKVASVYQTILRQLPSDPQLDTFVSSQQMAVTQLGIAYCDAAIEDSALRSTWFPGIDFNQPASSFVSEPNQSSFLNLLLNRLQPLSPTHSAPRPQVTAELTALMTRLAACGTSCDAARSKTIAKAACTAVLASSETLVY